MKSGGRVDRADGRWHRRARPLLGTVVEISARVASLEDFVLASETAFGVIARYHAAMSFHEASSDVRAIAAAAAGTTIPVAPETWSVVATALAIEEASGGVFGIAVGEELIARHRLPPASRPTGARRRVAAGRALRLGQDHRITIVEPVCIDLGGIAKGAAVDAALAALRAAGIAAAVVNAGGDLAVYGVPQSITVRGPDGALRTAGTLADGAAATSGPFAAGAASALVVHGSSPPRWADRAVTVVAPTCLTADALTKVVAVLGDASAALLGRYEANAFSTDASGRVFRVERPA